MALRTEVTVTCKVVVPLTIVWNADETLKNIHEKASKVAINILEDKLIASSVIVSKMEVASVTCVER